MKQYTLLSLLVLVGLSGCCGWRKKKEQQVNRKEQVVVIEEEVNIPLANEEVQNFLLDENVDELTIVDDAYDYPFDGQNSENQDAQLQAQGDFSWIEEAAENDRQFKNVYFAFDSYEIAQDQEETLMYNIALAKRVVDEHLLFGDKSHQPTIIIDGNSCNSAGSKAYNLVLSEQRAEALQERFVAAGIAREYIKIVGRGSEVPAIKDGKVVTGDRQQQWPNRRDEVHIIFG